MERNVDKGYVILIECWRILNRLRTLSLSVSINGRMNEVILRIIPTDVYRKGSTGVATEMHYYATEAFPSASSFEL